MHMHKYNTEQNGIVTLELKISRDNFCNVPNVLLVLIFAAILPSFFFRLHIVDDPVLGQLIESLPPLHPCELLDPADDQTLPRLIEVLEQRHRIRQTITEQVNRTGM